MLEERVWHGDFGAHHELLACHCQCEGLAQKDLRRRLWDYDLQISPVKGGFFWPLSLMVSFSYPPCTRTLGLFDLWFMARVPISIVSAWQVVIMCQQNVCRPVPSYSANCYKVANCPRRNLPKKHIYLMNDQKLSSSKMVWIGLWNTCYMNDFTL